MRSQYAAIVFSLLLGACATSDDHVSKAPTTPSAEVPAVGETPSTDPKAQLVPEVVPDPAPAIATPSVASVQLLQDCPDLNAQLKSGSAAKSKRKRGKGASSFRQPCSQSTLQLAFTGQKDESSVATIKAVRLQSADGKALGGLATRMPTIWKATGYQPWDGTIEAGADHKASYKLSVPDWSAVETALSGSSYGRMYTVEVDVEIQGKVTTVTSPQFERGRAQIIKTWPVRPAEAEEQTPCEPAPRHVASKND